MKTCITRLTAACALLLAASGCSKTEEAATTAPSQISGDVTRTRRTATATAHGQTEVVKPKSVEAAITSAQPVAAAAAAVKAEAQAQAGNVQALIDQARKLLSENKWSEALASLKQLSSQNLTPEQQSLVQSLTAQAQKAGESAAKAKATEEATKAAGGLLPK